MRLEDGDDEAEEKEDSDDDEPTPPSPVIDLSLAALPDGTLASAPLATVADVLPMVSTVAAGGELILARPPLDGASVGRGDEEGEED